MAVSNTQRDLSQILKTSQQKAISTSVFTIALLAVLVWGSLRPTILTILETNQKYQEKTTLLKALKDQNSNLTRLLTDREDIKTKLQNTDYYFPDDGNFSLFIVNLNLIAHKYNYQLEDVTFSETINNQISDNPIYQYDYMTPTTFNISLRGDPSSLFAFLSYLESTPFLPKIININYSNTTIGDSKKQVSVTLIVYKFQEKLFE